MRPPGCGKSALIAELSRVVGAGPVTYLHLDDQTDVKSMLGAYVCTAVPGEFVWQPGPLAQVRGNVAGVDPFGLTGVCVCVRGTGRSAQFRELR